MGFAGGIENDAVGLHALFERFDLAFEDNNCHVVRIDMRTVARTRYQRRSMTVQFLQPGRRPLEQRLHAKAFLRRRSIDRAKRVKTSEP